MIACDVLQCIHNECGGCILDDPKINNKGFCDCYDLGVQCDCYHVDYIGLSRCYGTKEKDPCSCNGYIRQCTLK